MYGISEMNAFQSDGMKRRYTFSEHELNNVTKDSKKKTNKNYQDSVFKELLRDEYYQRMFLRDTCKAEDWDNVSIENIEITNMLAFDIYNDVCFRAGNRLIVLIEHQSTINPNMPLRMLFYLAEELRRLLKNNDKWGYIFDSKIVTLPKPEFYVVYTGTSPWNSNVLKLSDTFDTTTKNSFVELVVPILTRENSKGIIKEYTDLIYMIKQLHVNGVEYYDAIKEAVSEYSEGHIISKFLNEKEDIMDWMKQELSREERQELAMRARERRVAEEVTKEVTREVTEEVTREVTEEVTAAAIKDNYETLIEVGVSSGEAIKKIAEKKGMPVAEVEIIVFK